MKCNFLTELIQPGLHLCLWRRHFRHFFLVAGSATCHTRQLFCAAKLLSEP